MRSVGLNASGLALVPDVNLAQGETEVSITIVRDGYGSSSATFTTLTESAHYHTPPVVSSRPIRQPLRLLGALTLGITVALVAVGRYRAHRRGGQRCDHEPIHASVP